MSSVVYGIDLDLVDDTVVLTEDDLHDVKTAVLDLSYRWKSLGLALRLRNPDLNKIKYSHRDLDDCLEEALSFWLQKKYSVQEFGQPTWRMLVRAVAEDAGGKNPRLAEKIATKHPVVPMALEPAIVQAMDHLQLFHHSGPQTAHPGHMHATPQADAMALHSERGFMPRQLLTFTAEDAMSEENTSRHYVWVPRNRERVEVDGPGGQKMTFSRFQPYDPVETARWTSVRLSFPDVVEIDRRDRIECISAYPLKFHPHGIAVIINNEQFESMPTREGTEIDEHNLTKTFCFLGYIVEVYRNCTRDQVYGIFDALRLRSHRDYDSFVCCFLTHGKGGHLCGSDEKTIELDDLSRRLNAQSCPTLARKPKMFFIQACRGKIRDPAARIQSDSAEVRIDRDGGGELLEVPNEGDFLFSYATPSGQACFRDLDCGSWYVSELCKVLCRYSFHLDLNNMLKEVNKRVRKYEYQTYRQVPEVVERLEHNIYFF